MFEKDRTVGRHRGCEVRVRTVLLTATSRIRRPDGSWRESEPTVVGGSCRQWVAVRRTPTGQEEEIGTAWSEEDARRLIDSWLDGATPGL
jgi:hypothetical protein